MPRKVSRTPVEQQAFEITTRNRRAELQRLRRDVARQSVFENSRVINNEDYLQYSTFYG